MFFLLLFFCSCLLIKNITGNCDGEIEVECGACLAKTESFVGCIWCSSSGRCNGRADLRARRYYCPDDGAWIDDVTECPAEPNDGGTDPTPTPTDAPSLITDVDALARCQSLFLCSELDQLSGCSGWVTENADRWQQACARERGLSCQGSEYKEAQWLAAAVGPLACDRAADLGARLAASADEMSPETPPFDPAVARLLGLLSKLAGNAIFQSNDHAYQGQDLVADARDRLLTPAYSMCDQADDLDRSAYSCDPLPDNLVFIGSAKASAPTSGLSGQVVRFVAKDSAAFVVYDPQQHRVIVVFKPTTSTREWVSNFLLSHGTYLDADRKDWGSVHAGFRTGYRALKPHLMQLLQRTGLLDPASSLWSAALPELWLAGHSLGGALATIAAVDLHADIGLWPTVYTYGSPRVGTPRFVSAVHASTQAMYRVEHGSDSVTGVPIGPMRRHASSGLVLTPSSWHHAGLAAYYQRDQWQRDPSVCPWSEAGNCGVGPTFRFSWSDHSNYMSYYFGADDNGEEMTQLINIQENPDTQTTVTASGVVDFEIRLGQPDPDVEPECVNFREQLLAKGQQALEVATDIECLLVAPEAASGSLLLSSVKLAYKYAFKAEPDPVKQGGFFDSVFNRLTDEADGLLGFSCFPVQQIDGVISSGLESWEPFQQAADLFSTKIKCESQSDFVPITLDAGSGNLTFTCPLPNTPDSVLTAEPDAELLANAMPSFQVEDGVLDPDTLVWKAIDLDQVKDDLKKRAVFDQLQTSSVPAAPGPVVADFEPKSAVIISMLHGDEAAHLYETVGREALALGIDVWTTSYSFLAEKLARTQGEGGRGHVVDLRGGAWADKLDRFHLGPWTRDYTPLFVRVPETRQFAVRSFVYHEHLPSEVELLLDPSSVSQDHTVSTRDFEWEGGNIAANGRGRCLTTARTYRQNGGSKGVHDFNALFGCTDTLLVYPMPKEKTGHVDLFAQFLSPTKLLFAMMPAVFDPEIRATLQRNLDRIRKRWPDVSIVEIPMMPSCGPNRFRRPDKRAGIRRLSFTCTPGSSIRSFANFFNLNGRTAVVPTFRKTVDELACGEYMSAEQLPVLLSLHDTLVAKLKATGPEGGGFRRVVEVPWDRTFVTEGAVHCLTATVPAGDDDGYTEPFLIGDERMGVRYLGGGLDDGVLPPSDSLSATTVVIVIAAVGGTVAASFVCVAVACFFALKKRRLHRNRSEPSSPPRPDFYDTRRSSHGGSRSTLHQGSRHGNIHGRAGPRNQSLDHVHRGSRSRSSRRSYVRHGLSGAKLNFAPFSFE